MENQIETVIIAVQMRDMTTESLSKLAEMKRGSLLEIAAVAVIRERASKRASKEEKVRAFDGEIDWSVKS